MNKQQEHKLRQLLKEIFKDGNQDQYSVQRIVRQEYLGEFRNDND